MNDAFSLTCLLLGKLTHKAGMNIQVRKDFRTEIIIGIDNKNTPCEFDF